LAACANSTASLPPSLLKPPDPRIGRLERFFRRYNCPAPHYVSEYLRAADRFGLDYRLLPALSVRETQCGRTEVRHNRWGYHSGRQGFASIEAGIEFVARVLSQSRLYRDKPLHKKLFIYNPRPAYPGEVDALMHQIE